jgi:hypothetical protein
MWNRYSACALLALATNITLNRFVCVSYFANARSYESRNLNFIQARAVCPFNIKCYFEVNISYDLFILYNAIISYLKYENGRLTGLVTCYAETAF